jgi:hypothetical protein
VSPPCFCFISIQINRLIDIYCRSHCIPDGVVGIFHWHNPSGHTLALGLTQPLTEMSTRNILGGTGDRCLVLTILPPSCADCNEIWEPQLHGTLRACTGLYRVCFTFTLYNNEQNMFNVQQNTTIYSCDWLLPFLCFLLVYHNGMWNISNKKWMLKKIYLWSRDWKKPLFLQNMYYLPICL